MRKFILIAAMVVGCASAAQAGDSRSLSLAELDEKLPAALGKAAEAPRIVEAPKPPETPKAAEAPKPAEAAKPSDEQPPQFVARPAAVGKKAEPGKAGSSKDGQVTFEEKKPVAGKDGAAVEAQDKPVQDKSAIETKPEQRTARSEKPRRKRVQYWDEARIIRELYRYGVIAGGW